MLQVVCRQLNSIPNIAGRCYCTSASFISSVNCAFAGAYQRLKQTRRAEVPTLAVPSCYFVSRLLLLPLCCYLCSLVGSDIMLFCLFVICRNSVSKPQCKRKAKMSQLVRVVVLCRVVGFVEHHNKPFCSVSSLSCFVFCLGSESF